MDDRGICSGLILHYISYEVPHRAVIGVDGLVGLPSFCIHKLSINEQLMRHLYGHVVDVLLHL